MNIETFEKIPAAVLTDATVKPAPEKSTTGAAENKINPTIDDIFKANSNTNIPLSSVNETQQGTQPPAQQTTSGNSVAVGDMIESKLAIELIDALLPALFVSLLYMADIKLRKTELQLTEKEKSTIAPIMQKCLNTIMLNFSSPWTTLAVTLGVIYGSKVGEKGLVNWIDKLNEKKELEALEEKTGIRKPVAPVVKINKPTEQKQETIFQNVPINPINSIQETIPDINAPKPYGENEIKKIMGLKNYGRNRAVAWLNKNFYTKYAAL